MARNLRLSEMGLDELLTEMHKRELAREDDFNVNDEGYGREIQLHKYVLRELRNPKNNASKDMRANVEHKLSKLLYNHGSEMKFRGQGSRQDAEKSLGDALSLDRKNGMAAYRLAFIHYRMNHYREAIRYFNCALENTIHDEPIFCLSDREIYYARLYLLASYLNEVDQLNEELEVSPAKNKYKDLPQYDSYGVKDFISDLGVGLTNQEYEVITDEDNRYVSYDEVEGYFQKGDRPEGTLIIWFDGVNSKMAFNQSEMSFRSEVKARQLVYLLRFTSHNNPGNEHSMQNCFEEMDNTPFVTNERLRTAISQLRSLLNELDPRLGVITTSRSPNPSGYYYSGKVPYMIICRSEESSLLDQ
jgi:tetratricopeptide (TPR) repeat protein